MNVNKSMACAILPLAWAVSAACSGGDQASPEANKPAETAPAAAPKKPAGFIATMNQLGPIQRDTIPNLVGLKGALGDAYEVRQGKEGTFDVVKDGAVLVNVKPNVAGTGIERAVSTHKDVAFPWNTHVGDRIGSHKNWERMTCRPSTIQPGTAICYAFEDAHFGYLVPISGSLPEKAAVAELSIQALVWTPDGRKG